MNLEEMYAFRKAIGVLETAVKSCGETIAEKLTTPNVVDKNGEPGNIPEALFAIAEALEECSRAIVSLRTVVARATEHCTKGGG